MFLENLASFKSWVGAVFGILVQSGSPPFNLKSGLDYISLAFLVWMVLF